MTAPTFNILLTGAPNVGKTSFISSLKTGSHAQRIPSPFENAVVTSFSYRTNYGTLNLNVHDTDIYGTRGYPSAPIDGIIVMYSLVDARSIETLPMIISKLTREYPDTKMVIVGNKCELSRKPVYLNLEQQHYHVSSKTKYNYEKPFLYLMRELTNNPKLKYYEGPSKMRSHL